MRIATSLARLRRCQGRPEEALAILTPVYARFTQGFTTRDLLAAADLQRALDDDLMEAWPDLRQAC